VWGGGVGVVGGGGVGWGRVGGGWGGGLDAFLFRLLIIWRYLDTISLVVR